jgi:hypothetical protein
MHISAPLKRSINARLGACKTTLDVADVFEHAITSEHFKATMTHGADSIKALADSINAAVESVRVNGHA